MGSVMTSGLGHKGSVGRETRSPRRGSSRLQRGSDAGAAFTLVELLVVVAILGVLIAITLSALGGAMATARAAKCQSNLRQVQSAWLMYIEGANGIIPHTRKSYLDPNWIDALDSIAAPDEHLLGNDRAGFSACPEIEAAYEVSYVNGRWGYAVNTWWDNVEKTHSDRRKWSALRQPSSYPCFTDPDVIERDFGRRAAERVPRKASGGFGAPNWGVGPVHGEKTTANVAYADGSARGTNIQTVREGAAGVEDWPWFANHR